MKGPHARHPGLRRRLAAAFLLPIVALSAVGFAYDCVVARRLTDDAYDQSIAGVAEGLALTLETDRDNDLPVHFRSMMRTLQRIDAPDTWRFVVRNAAGRLIDGDPSLQPQSHPGSSNPSFETVSSQAHPERVATYLYSGRNGAATIVVAETLTRRSAASQAIIGATLWPNLALMCVAIVLMLVTIPVALRPLHRLGRHVNAQAGVDIAPFPLDGAPVETLPLLESFNRLLDRLKWTASSQQVFINRAAHQLRTPLAALQAQIELLHDAPERAVRQRASALGVSAARLVRLTNQLLMLGRTDRGAAVAVSMAEVDVVELITGLAAVLDDRAQRGRVWLAFELAPLRIQGIDWMLREALGNLVDNAIAHSPPGASITLRSISPDSVAAGRIEVEDRGVGIAPDDRERVFHPFVRLDETRQGGSGLGLAIVREIVERHHATVVIEPGGGGCGTCVRIIFA